MVWRAEQNRGMWRSKIAALRLQYAYFAASCQFRSDSVVVRVSGVHPDCVGNPGRWGYESAFMLARRRLDSRSR